MSEIHQCKNCEKLIDLILSMSEEHIKTILSLMLPWKSVDEIDKMIEIKR